MTNHVALNNIVHKDLRVITKKSRELGDQIASTLTFPTEFADVQREYPILFRKDPESGAFQSVAIFGFEQNENLFLDEDGWHASYIPVVVERGPFLIGFQNQDDDKKVPVIHIDTDSPRVSTSEGEPIFLEFGGNSPYLERVSRMMTAIHDGVEVSKTMFAAFLDLDLIEPINIEVELKDGTKGSLAGFYTVHEEKLRELHPDALARLNSSGLLQAAYMVISSLTNVKKLIEMKNRRL